MDCQCYVGNCIICGEILSNCAPPGYVRAFNDVYVCSGKCFNQIVKNMADILNRSRKADKELYLMITDFFEIIGLGYHNVSR